MTNRLLTYHYKINNYDLLSKLNYTNIMQLPKFLKIKLHLTINETVTDKNKIFIGLLILELIAGQKAQFTKIKKSILGFKVQKKMKIGAQVVLRNTQMYYFLDKLINLSFPKVKNFNGIEGAIDKYGHYNFGITNFLIFPEIEHLYHKFNKIFGLNITIYTTAKSKLELQLLLQSINFPLK